VLVLHYFGEHSLRAVARRLAISAQRASQLHIAAIGRLRRNGYAESR
jgi:DNA-directed RNA polymerase specialized sigma subunit